MHGSSLFRISALLVASAVLTVLVVAAFSGGLRSASASGSGLLVRTTSHEPHLPNYDIRTDKTAWQKRLEYRNASGIALSDIESAAEGFRLAEASLRRRVPRLKVDYNEDLRIPEVIGTDATLAPSFLTGPNVGNRGKALRDFLRENEQLIGSRSRRIDSLVEGANYVNPDGNLSFVELNQQFDGIPVFRGEVKAGFTRRGEIVRIINNLAPNIDESMLSQDFGDPRNAVVLAAEHAGAAPPSLEIAEHYGNRVAFGTEDSSAIAEKIYFPLEPGVAIPAWRVAIWRAANAFSVIVDANSGILLWRKNATEDQTQPATYGVYANPNAMINVADNPFPFTPGPAAPTGLQGPSVSRTSIIRIGNEPPYQFNSLGWIPDGGVRTDGNAIQAGLDRDGTDGVDPNSEAFSPVRNFSYSYAPFNPNTNSGDAPVPTTQTYPGTPYQQGSVSQLFYISNWFHDELYRLGFTEQARNFQHDNFGRGGAAGDRVRGEGQDSLGFNNANFSTFQDGIRPRMQMYLWSGPDPDVDGNLDAEVVIHEYTHGLSNRLHGNASGLTMNMSRGLGEGWSDFYAHAMLSEPSDPIQGIYTIGGYATYLGGPGYTNNYYYGIRRFPKAVKAFTGANGLPHNPLTFADADQTELNLSDGAFPRGPYGSDNADAVHNLGEIWSSALWEIRARMIHRLGWAVGNRRILQLVTDGMKLAPLAPTFITERDALIAAAQASSAPEEAALDVADIWAGFAIRGLGASASIQANGTGVGDARVTEAFDLPNLTQTGPITFLDSAGNNNGSPDPGESLLIDIPLTNATGIPASGATLSIVGGGMADHGTLGGVATVSRQVALTVPANLSCGSLFTLTINVNSSLGPVAFVRSFSLGSPLITDAESFDSVAAPQLPAGWASSAYNGGLPFVTSSSSPASVPNSAFAPNPATVGGGTDLTSPIFTVNAGAPMLEFRHLFNTEAAWDGGVLEIRIAGGPFQDIEPAGGVFVSNGYNSTLGNGTNNPLSNRPAWSGESGGYITTKVRLPPSAAGQNVQFRWRFGADDNTAPVGGWHIDDIRVIGNYACPAASRARADFDGDGRSDLSVFRPSNRIWYLDRTSSGFTAVAFGVSSDIPTPGDFDGDGKADIAVYRPSEGNWYRLNSSDGSYTVLRFGVSEDIPQPGDFDGDRKDDIAVWRPSNQVWYWLRSSDGSSGSVSFGSAGDKPVANDYDGDGREDIAVWRPSNGIWYFLYSSTGTFSGAAFGLAGDRPVPADFDGDSRADIAVYRPSNGTWYDLSSRTGDFSAIRFGIESDIPVPGDFDGDGRTDQAVYRSGTWYLNRSSAGFGAASFGLPQDIPVPSKYIP
jgi:hypothetical protein